MKRFFLSFLTLLLVATAANAITFYNKGIQYETYGSNGYFLRIMGLDPSYTGNIEIVFGLVTYTYDGKSYTGECADINSGVTFQSNPRITRVTCTRTSMCDIPQACFQYCTNLTYVNLSTIESTDFDIQDYAFSNCSKLTTVLLPKQMWKIGDYAFYGCAMSSMTFYETRRIGPHAFMNNSNLKTIVWNNPMTLCEYDTPLNTLNANSTTSQMPFYQLRNQITTVTVNTNATNCVFYGMTALKNLTFGSDVKSVGENAFGNCTALTTWTGGNNIHTFRTRAFSGCTALTKALSMTNPGNGNYYTLDDYAFYNTRISSLTIGTAADEENSYIYMGDHVFQNCSAMTSVTLHASLWGNNNPTDLFTGCTGVTSLFWGCGWYEPNESDFAYQGSFISKLTNLKFAEINRKNQIYRHEFYNLTKLETVYIDERVTYVSENAFYNCTALNYVIWSVLGDKNNYGSPEQSPFAGSPLKTFRFAPNVTHIPANLLAGQRQLTNIQVYLSSLDLPEGLKTIGAKAFYAVPLTSLALPTGIESIGSGAFYGCKMTSITIPASLTSIGEQVFVSNNGPMTINWNARRCKFDYSNKMDGWGVFYPGSSDQSISRIEFGSNVEALPARLCFNALKLTNISLPASLQSIGDSAFNACSNLTYIRCDAVVPPTLEGTQVFTSINKNDPKGLKGVTLVVPDNSLARYKAAEGWKEFFEEESEGIEDVQRDDVQCTKVLRDGMLIIRAGNKEYNAQGIVVK